MNKSMYFIRKKLCEKVIMVENIRTSKIINKVMKTLP